MSLGLIKEAGAKLLAGWQMGRVYPAHLLCSDCLAVLGPSSRSRPAGDLCTCWGAAPHRSKAVSFSSFRFGLKCPFSEQPSLLTQLKLPHPCASCYVTPFFLFGHLSAPGINHWLCWSLCLLLSSQSHGLVFLCTGPRTIA